jgi:hypothetical protein
MINNKNSKNKSKNEQIKNLEYKNKYLKYKNKYFKLTGGSETVNTILLITGLIGILSAGGYILYNQLNTNETTSRTNIINSNKFMIDLKALINKTGSTKKFIENYFTYSSINLVYLIEKSNKNKTNSKNKTSMETLMLNYILKKELYTPIKLVNIKNLQDSRDYSDTLILCLESIFKKSSNNLSNKNYNTIKNELIEYIEQNKSFDEFFEYNKNRPLHTIPSQFNMFTNPTNPLNLTQTSKYSSKEEYIKYIKTSNNYVSDIPMIKAAAEKYNKYILVNIELSNSKYLKIFTPNQSQSITSLNQSNLIILDYINMCDYNCDFIKNINNNIEKNTDFYKNKNIKNKVYFDTDKLSTINNFNNFSNLSTNFKKNSEIEISTNSYNEKEVYDNIELVNTNKLIHYEKQLINEKIAKRPYYQYYDFYDKKDKDIINKYFDENIKQDKK